MRDLRDIAFGDLYADTQFTLGDPNQIGQITGNIFSAVGKVAQVIPVIGPVVGAGLEVAGQGFQQSGVERKPGAPYDPTKNYGVNVQDQGRPAWYQDLINKKAGATKTIESAIDKAKEEIKKLPPWVPPVAIGAIILLILKGRK